MLRLWQDRRNSGEKKVPGPEKTTFLHQCTRNRFRARFSAFTFSAQRSFAETSAPRTGIPGRPVKLEKQGAMGE